MARILAEAGVRRRRRPHAELMVATPGQHFRRSRRRADRLWTQARAGQLRHLSAARKGRLVDRYRRLLIELGQPLGAVNSRVGRFDELIRTPGRSHTRAQQSFRGGSILVVGQDTAGSTRPDFSRWRRDGHRWHVNLKGNVLASRPLADLLGVARANQRQAVRNAAQLPLGDELVLRYRRLRDEAALATILGVHFGAGSPVARVDFGTDAWDRARWERARPQLRAPLGERAAAA